MGGGEEEMTLTMLLWPDGAPLAAGDGEEDRPAITCYPAESRCDAAIIICPGGGYMRRAAHEAEPVARWLNGLGIHAFVLRYRVAPYRYPCALSDAQRAIRHVRHHAREWGIDPGKIGILGFSAGGHLAASVGTRHDEGDPSSADPVDRESCRPDALVLCYPVITMRDPHAHRGSRENLLGPEPDDALVGKMSIEEQVDERTPPTFLWHTADDSAVPVENSLMLAAALSRHGVPYELHIFEKGRHGLGLAEEDPHTGKWTEVCASWLRRHQFGSRH